LGRGQLLPLELAWARQLDPRRQDKALGFGNVGERGDGFDRQALIDEQHLPEDAAGGEIHAAAGHHGYDVGSRLGPVDRDIEPFVLEVIVVVGDRHLSPSWGSRTTVTSTSFCSIGSAARADGAASDGATSITAATVRLRLYKGSRFMALSSGMFGIGAAHAACVPTRSRALTVSSFGLSS
jgi:hypothetical protein